MAATADPVYHTSGFIRLTRPQLVGTLGGLLLALLVAALDQTVVGTAEPRIIASLSGFDRYPWVATAYMLSMTVSVPIFAKLSDIYGRKWFFLSGLIIFVIASAFCGASGQIPLPLDGMNQLILFRGIQGIGAGMLFGLTFTIVGDIFSPIERGKYQGIFAAVWGLASIFGPTLGGWLTDYYSWRAVFYVNLPVGLIAAIAIWMEFPSFRPRGVERKIDFAGVFALILCLVPLLLALTWVTDYGWTSTRVESLLTFSTVMLAVFLFAETRASEPLIPLVLFRNPIIAICSIASFVLGMGMFGIIIYLPLFMQGVMGVSATQSGSLLTPMMMAAVVGSIGAGQFTSRSGKYKILALAGSTLIAIGMILFAQMNGDTLRVEVVRGMVIVGLGIGLIQPVYTLAVQNAAPREHLGAATASTQFFRSIGSTMGVSIFGSLLLTIYKHDFNGAVPNGTPAMALKPFNNPLMLAQIRPQLEAGFGRYSGGPELLKLLLANVRTSLVHGIHAIFFVGAIIMCGAVVLNVFLREVRLKSRMSVEPEVG
ncbi:MAG TPA: MDR family MFS transporter [Bryobacteraceae bacterium]|nr:MDR family MFS transporter [Bryobacteraceae bacterium]